MGMGASAMLGTVEEIAVEIVEKTVRELALLCLRMAGGQHATPKNGLRHCEAPLPCVSKQHCITHPRGCHTTVVQVPSWCPVGPAAVPSVEIKTPQIAKVT